MNGISASSAAQDIYVQQQYVLNYRNEDELSIGIESANYSCFADFNIDQRADFSP
jgi:hypothetical protein